MSLDKVPFSWENEPGVSKVSDLKDDDGPRLSFKLPPPPCPTESGRVSVRDIQIPLPPCAFQPPSRSSSRRGLGFNKHDQDPFLAAFKECTKNSRKGKLRKKAMFNFSCKNSCGVRDDNLVRVSHQLPNYNKDGGEM